MITKARTLEVLSASPGNVIAVHVEEKTEAVVWADNVNRHSPRTTYPDDSWHGVVDVIPLRHVQELLDAGEIELKVDTGITAYYKKVGL